MVRPTDGAASLGRPFTRPRDGPKRIGRFETTALITELAPELPNARSNLGWAHLLKGATDRGLAELEKAVALRPGTSLCSHSIGIRTGPTANASCGGTRPRCTAGSATSGASSTRN